VNPKNLYFEDPMLNGTTNIDKNVASLVEIIDDLLKGEFDIEEAAITPEGMLSTLTQKINAVVRNMKTLQLPLTKAGEHAPNAVSSAKNIVELISRATDTVLDKSDELTELADTLETQLSQNATGDSKKAAASGQTLLQIKESVYDIIASQSFQDVARQKLETLINDLNQIQTWLIEALIILNLQKNSSQENIQEKSDMLKEVNASKNSDPLKQDLVDDLLAEFGF